MEDNNNVTPQRGLARFRILRAVELTEKGGENNRGVGPRAMAFPEPKPLAPELPQKLLKTLDCSQGAVRAVRFNVDGNYCLTCGSDKTLKLWNPLRGTLLRTYSGHGYEVLDAAGSFDNSSLCSGGGDKAVVLWDVASGQVVRKFRGHAGKVNTVQFNEEATVILSGSIDSSIRCWDCRSRRPEPVQTLDEARDGVSSVKVSDHEVLSGSVDGRVRRYDLRMGQLFSDYVGSPITCTCFSRDGQCTLISSLDSTLRLLDKDTGELLGECVSTVSPGPLPSLPPLSRSRPQYSSFTQVHGPQEPAVQAGLQPQCTGHTCGQLLGGREGVLLGPGGGFSGTGPACRPRCGAVTGLPPPRALPAHCHGGQRAVLARRGLRG
ncbi:WD repeat domain-containing protein 83 isoform X1 [Cavia porcellus]|uniref:WD repeat domain-containing protein 83 isoform X1 n=1 Tax=Cavia porcellus TaxID=10141 RepID=UPI000661D57E|nr:WD repeat domain-containing protein 83 isoform X1 [Cavia porcellus]